MVTSGPGSISTLRTHSRTTARVAAQTATGSHTPRALLILSIVTSSLSRPPAAGAARRRGAGAPLTVPYVPRCPLVPAA
ncbi:hypothetical protein Srufu_057470 [Streptomyces libani subsp. rufus]|nr:hypothetical protein Srufu_057470 [Streptomyces libani subsp. rufus]